MKMSSLNNNNNKRKRKDKEESENKNEEIKSNDYLSIKQLIKDNNISKVLKIVEGFERLLKIPELRESIKIEFDGEKRTIENILRYIYNICIDYSLDNNNIQIADIFFDKIISSKIAICRCYEKGKCEPYSFMGTELKCKKTIHGVTDHRKNFEAFIESLMCCALIRKRFPFLQYLSDFYLWRLSNTNSSNGDSTCLRIAGIIFATGRLSLADEFLKKAGVNMINDKEHVVLKASIFFTYGSIVVHPDVVLFILKRYFGETINISFNTEQEFKTQMILLLTLGLHPFGERFIKYFRKHLDLCKQSPEKIRRIYDIFFNKQDFIHRFTFIKSLMEYHTDFHIFCCKHVDDNVTWLLGLMNKSFLEDRLLFVHSRTNVKAVDFFNLYSETTTSEVNKLYQKEVLPNELINIIKGYIDNGKLQIVSNNMNDSNNTIEINNMND